MGITNVLCITTSYFCEHMHVHSAYTENVEEQFILLLSHFVD